MCTNKSDEMKKLSGMKKDILSFAFPKSVISLTTNFNRNAICFSSSSYNSASTIIKKHWLSQKPVPTAVSLSSTAFPSRNAAFNSHN